MCLDNHVLDPAKFLSVPGLAWQAALKKTKVKLELLINIDMFQWLKKELGAGYIILLTDIKKLIINL